MVKNNQRFRKEVIMSKEWQQTRYKHLVLPKEVYYQSVWAVRDLERMEARLAEDVYKRQIPGRCDSFRAAFGRPGCSLEFEKFSIVRF